MGDERMDEQHQALIGYINDFYAVAEKGDLEGCKKVFGRVVDFTRYHFNDEEKMLEKINYPDLSKHKFIHKQLVSRVTELGAKLDSGDKQSPAEIKLFLKSWLTAHIKGIDMKYSGHVSD